MDMEDMKFWKIYVKNKLVEIIPMGFESGLVLGWLQDEYGDSNVNFKIMTTKEMENDNESLNWVDKNYNFFGKRTTDSIMDNIKKQLKSF
jgi:hypothetical protein